MEIEAKTNGISIKAFRSDNEVFEAAKFTADLDNLHQHITYCGFGTHHLNGIAERYLRTMVEKATTVLLNAHAHWSKSMKMEMWTYAFRHIVTQWINTPRRDLEYKTPDKNLKE